MLLVAPVKQSRQIPMNTAADRLWGIEKLNVVRSDIPAVTHIDYSARVQTVSRETNPDYYDLIHEFECLTGCAVLVNTSFNVHGDLSSARLPMPIDASCAPTSTTLCSARLAGQGRAARTEGERQVARGVSARLTPAEGRKFGIPGRRRLPRGRGLMWRRGHLPGAYVAAAAGALLLVGGLAAPVRLEPVYRAWMALALAISKVTTPVSWRRSGIWCSRPPACSSGSSATDRSWPRAVLQASGTAAPTATGVAPWITNSEGAVVTSLTREL